ncbi:hypothetical protein [Cupriavidus necator]
MSETSDQKPRADTAESNGESPYAQYLRAKEKRLETGAFSRDIVRTMQQAFARALKSGEPMPEEMLVELRFAFEDLCAGIKPDLFSVIAAGGAEPPIAKYLQQDGLRYIEWAQDGRIDDPTPVATVAKAYGVTQKTVRKWRQKQQEDGIALPKLVFDNAEHVRRMLKIASGQYKARIPKRGRQAT